MKKDKNKVSPKTKKENSGKLRRRRSSGRLKKCGLTER